MAVKKREWTNRDGSIGTSYQVGYTDNARKWRTKAFDKKRDADRFLEETKRAVRRGTHVVDTESVTVEVACTRWLDRLTLDGREPSTLRQYKNHVDNHIVPALGSILLTRLNQPTVEEFRDDLLRANTRTMARKILTSFKSMVAQSKSKGLIGYNVAADVEIDSSARQTTDAQVNRIFPQPDEIRRIIEATSGMTKVLTTVLAFTGLSSSEVRGLPWSNIDFTRHVLHVRQRADEFNNIGLCKTKARYRTIPLAERVELALKEWQLACPNGPLNLVFPNASGRIEAHNVLLDRRVYPVQLKALGEEKFGLHDFRHFFASWRIAEGDNPKRVQALMGHSSIRVTLDVYGHLFQDSENDHESFGTGAAKVMANR